MTEADMPPPQRPKARCQEGEQKHLREDAGMTTEGLGGEPAEHTSEDVGQDRA